VTVYLDGEMLHVVVTSVTLRCAFVLNMYFISKKARTALKYNRFKRPKKQNGSIAFL
jgi:hypothetical protein